MCSKISWEQFLMVAGGIIAIYYIIVGVLYYRKDISSVVKNVGRGPSNNKHSGDGDRMSYNEFTAESGDALTDKPK